MRILHTADWHLGHRLLENSQKEEQALFLEWLEEYIDKSQIDVLLISGDIFDTASPSSQSLTMYYDFLVRLTKTNCKHVVVTGGNHDSPGILNAPKNLLKALSVKVVGKPSEDCKEDVFMVEVNGEELIIAAVPYLRDQDIRRAVVGETFDEISDRYKQALMNHYHKVAAHCKTIKTENTPIIAMGHLFAVGGTISDSEQNIYVGSLGHIGASDFPDMFDYIALGHLHRPQVIGRMEHIRYSGSPYILSFSEIAFAKKVVQISTEKNTIKSIEEIEVPRFREVVRISGTLEECIDKLPNIMSNKYKLTPWVEVVLDNDNGAIINSSTIYEQAEKHQIKVLKTSLKNSKNTVGIEQLLAETKHIKELSPIAVFEMKCKEQGIEIKEHQEIWDAFNEALQIAKGQ